MIHFLRGVLLLAAAAVCLEPAVGAITIRPQIVAAYSSDGLYTPLPLPDFGSATGPQIYEIALSFTASDLAADRGIANLGFAVTLDGLTSVAGGYSPDHSSFDLNGNAPGGVVPKFAMNADIGPSSTDLRGIFVSVLGPGEAFAADDPRERLGQDEPANFGSIFVLWDGNEDASLTLHGITPDAGIEISEFVPTTTGGAPQRSAVGEAPGVTLFFSAPGSTSGRATGTTAAIIPPAPAPPVETFPAPPTISEPLPVDVTPPVDPIIPPPLPWEGEAPVDPPAIVVPTEPVDFPGIVVPPLVDPIIDEPSASPGLPPVLLPNDPPNSGEGETSVEAPTGVVEPTEPIVPISPIDEIIGDPTLIDIDMPYPPISIGYDPSSHEYWELIWNCDLTDFTIIDGGILRRPLIAYDGGFQTTSIYSPVEAYLFGMSTGAGTAWNVSQALGAADGGGSARVPEPATALLTLVAAIALATAARRGR